MPTQIPPQARHFIEENVHQNKVVLFTKSQCHNSAKAKSIVGGMLPPDKYKVVDVGGAGKNMGFSYFPLASPLCVPCVPFKAPP